MPYKARGHPRGSLQPPMKLVSIPANPVPDDAVAGNIKTSDGVNLRFARFAPPPGRKGTVVVLQGRAEFIEKYFETVRDLRARGFAVATFDWRGQGLSDRRLSDRRKGYVRDFSQYATDLDTVMAQVVLPDCPPPIYCLAHSMGAAVVIRACHSGRRWFDRVVLSAPMIGLPPGRLRTMTGTLARLLRYMGRGGAYVPSGGPEPSGAENFLGNLLTSDPVRYARNAAVLEVEPALGLGAPTVAWTDAALKQMKQLRSPGYAASRFCSWRPAAIRSSLRRRSRNSDCICLPAAISSWLAAGTRFCRNRVNTGTSSGPLSTLSCQVRRGTRSSIF